MMTQYTLVLLDTTGTQGYIYASNRLQEIIGASQLVQEATQDWVYEQVQEAAGGAHNIADLKTGRLKPGPGLEAGSGWRAEVIYAGGGNTAILFQGEELARKFTQALTRKVIKEA